MENLLKLPYSMKSFCYDMTVIANIFYIIFRFIGCHIKARLTAGRTWRPKD